MRQRCRGPLVLLWLALLLLLSPAAQPAPAADTPRLVRYPNINGTGRQGLGYRMLDLALRCSGRPYRLQLLPDSANTNRVRALLESGEADVVDFGSTPEYEQRYAAVYLPIDRGLNGWRLLVVRHEDREAFASVKSLAELSRFVAGQGQGWPDADILRSAGLPVRTFPQLESLFHGLEAGRFDYLPLGMDEAHDLARHYASSPDALDVNTRIVIVYPFGRLFFTRKDDTALHDLIDAGLHKAFATGQAQKLLAEDPGYAQALKQQGPQLLKLHIDNPALSPRFRAIPPDYFLH